MTRKIISTWGMIFILLVSVVGGAAAQTGEEPATPPPPENGSTYYSHPIVQILAAYFGRKGVISEPIEDPTETATEEPTVDPSATVTEESASTPEPPPGPEEIAEQIAQYHADGMGFGVLVKLYAIAEASAEKCATQSDPGGDEAAAAGEGCQVVTVEELVSEFQNGTGMGELFHTYGGKPALLGVGHVRKALKQMDDSAPALEATAEPTGEATVSPMTGDHQPKDKGGKPPKDPKPKGKPEKPPKPKGKDK